MKEQLKITVTAATTGHFVDLTRRFRMEPHSNSHTTHTTHSNTGYSSLDNSPTINSSSIETSDDHAIDESNTLFLGDLPPSATALQISELFADLEVSHVEIKIVNSVKGSLCYAFVTFATPGELLLTHLALFLH